MKTLLTLILILMGAFSLFDASADSQITALDSGRYVTFDGTYWVYVWLNKDSDEVIYLIKSVYRPSEVGQKELKSTKKVLGTLEIGAKVQDK